VDALRILGALLVLAGVVLVVAPWRSQDAASKTATQAAPADRP
jgi:drug/metabolite transporter (DMT)-like permease